MKTVTNYAEKKAKQFLNLLQGYTKGIRITAILILLLMGVSNAWAASEGSSWYDWASSENVYFDNTNSSYSNVSMLIGRQWNYGGDGVGSSGVNFTKVENTNNLYHAATTWNHYNTLLFMDETGWGWEGNKVTQRYTYAKNYTNTNNININGTELFYAASSSKGATLNHQDLTSYTALNYTQTVQQHLSTDGGSNYSASTTALATVKVSSYKLKSQNATESSSGTIASGNSSTSCSAARTATVTYAVSGVKTGYTFVGWYDGTTQKSTSTTYTYNATAAKTITARFKENTYSVTVKNDGHGTTTPSGAQSNVGQVTGLSIKATPAANYEFINWTITSGSGSFGSATSASTTFKPISAATIQANFRSTATNSLTVVAGAGIASVTGSQDLVTLGSTYAITATPKTGYTFNTWTANPAENAAFGSETAANTTVTVKNGSVTVTASATEIKHDITVSYKFGSTTIKDNETISAVGEVIPTSVTAPKIDGYVFASWTLGAGIQSDNTSANPISITTTSSGPYTLTANYTEEQCVYFINTGNWSNVYIHAWKEGGEGTTWPGTKLTKTETIKGFDIYKYTLPAGKNYNKVIFHENTGDEHKTADLEWVNGKYYDFYQGKWFDRNEFEAMVSKIYFKNTLGWKNVYLYTFSTDVWVADQGVKPKNSRHDYGKMTQIENTGIFYYEISNCNFAHIAFSDADMSGYNEFYENNAVYRSEHNYRMSLFIPQIDQTPSTTNKTKYYSSGLWMKYNSTESGYNLVGGFNNWNDNADKFTAGSAGVYHFEVEMNLGASSTYEFKIKKDGINDWFGKNSKTIISTENSNIIFVSQEENVKIKTTSSGIHIFSIDLSEGKLNLSVEYPLADGDYRLIYVESNVLGQKPYTKFHPAQSIRHQAEGEKTDTISFYINKTTGKNPAILLQQCTIDGANTTWNDVAIQYINGKQGRNPGGAMAPAKRAGKLYIGSGCSAVEENGVYNFVLQQTNGEAAILSEETHPYTGDYYIRTDCADGGWRKYNTNPDNIMTHSQTALKHVDGGYDYYFCKWVENAGTNIKYTIANDYSYCVSDTLDGDTIASEGTLPAKANVRFTWNSNTNTLKRGYISGSSTASDRYLVLEGNEFLLDVEGNPLDIEDLEQHEALFEDMGNWVYQLDVQANNKTAIKLTAKYNGKVQTFFSTDAVANATSSDYYKVRFVYDFKTNNLVAAWLLEDENEVDGGKSLNSNMFIIRKHHEQAQQIKLDADLSGVGTAYGVMTFDKYFLNNRYSEGNNKGSELPENQRKSIYERALYWVSFPFDVRIRDVFGFGDYMDTWILEYYDGEARAKNGAWVDSETYWTYITNLDDTLKAGTGYVLCLDLEKMQYNSSVFRNTDEVSLYFPSTDTIGTIKSDQAVSITLPAHECTITRDDRNIYDSNWHVIGVPRFINLDIELTNIKQGATQDEVIFYYEYIPATDDYKAAQSTGEKTFQTMSAYMVQFAGTINWWEEANFPSSLAARRNTNAKTKSANLRLELTQDDAMVDQTFIQLQEEGATAEFDMNKDLTKIMNQGANIYSLIGNSRIRTAGNVLPLEEVVVPVGVTVSTAGTYTFAMPDGTDGITAILIDYETGKETNLLLADYTTELREGTNNERFALRVRPNHVATEVETIIDGANGQIQKYIINSALYILNNGQLYDAQGRMVQP